MSLCDIALEYVKEAVYLDKVRRVGVRCLQCGRTARLSTYDYCDGVRCSKCGGRLEQIPLDLVSRQR